MAAELTDAQVSALRVHSIDGCAPKFAAAVRAVVADLEAEGFDPVVFETIRCQALQAHYYACGTTQIPDAQSGWHFYGLAADLISRAHEWDAPSAFWSALRAAANRHGLTSGMDWKHPDGTGGPAVLHFVDRPHIQWGACRMAPSDTARTLYAQGGLPAVWAAVGAS